MQASSRPVLTAAAYYAAALPLFALILGVMLFFAAFVSGSLLPVVGTVSVLVFLPLTRRLVQRSGQGRFGTHFIRASSLYLYVVIGFFGFGGSFNPETASLTAFIALCLWAASGGTILLDLIASWFDMKYHPANSGLRAS